VMDWIVSAAAPPAARRWPTSRRDCRSTAAQTALLSNSTPPARDGVEADRHAFALVVLRIVSASGRQRAGGQEPRKSRGGGRMLAVVFQQGPAEACARARRRPQMQVAHCGTSTSSRASASAAGGAVARRCRAAIDMHPRRRRVPCHELVQRDRAAQLVAISDMPPLDHGGRARDQARAGEILPGGPAAGPDRCPTAAGSSMASW
jgi:hypothetical protein